MLRHVVVVTDSLSIDGGSAKVALGSALALARQGLHVTVFAATGDASPELRETANLDIVCTGQGEALKARNGLLGALQGLWNRQAYRRMNELLATLDRKHTVVHVHGWTKALSSSVIASIVRARFPIVVTLHEYFTACPTGCLYLHRDRRVCDIAPMSLQCVLKNCDSRSYAVKLYRVLRQAVQRTAGGVPGRIFNYVTVSGFSRRVIEPMLPRNSRYYAVDNPVEADFGPRTAAESNATFLYIGRLSAEKGGRLLADAAQRASVKVVFIGEGADRGEIMRINPDAECVGWLVASDVAARLRSARCLVVPSLWYETFGLVVLEAAALGIPAIVPAGTAPAELVQGGETGLLFERGDADDLAAQLRRCKDDALIARFSAAAYDRFWNKPPTISAHLDNLLTAYRAMVSTA
jgi:glycosyltransferase involved in cell wall biosynthesis